MMRRDESDYKPGQTFWEVRRRLNRYKRRVETLIHPVEVISVSEGEIRFLWNGCVYRRCDLHEAGRWVVEDPRRAKKVEPA